MCLKITKNIFSIDINMQVNLKISLSKKERKKEGKDTGSILGLKHGMNFRHSGQSCNRWPCFCCSSNCKRVTLARVDLGRMQIMQKPSAHTRCIQKVQLVSQYYGFMILKNIFQGNNQILIIHALHGYIFSREDGLIDDRMFIKMCYHPS